LAVVYFNDDTLLFDMVLAGELVANANFGTYSAVNDNWTLKQAGSLILALKDQSVDFADGTLLLKDALVGNDEFEIGIKSNVGGSWVTVQLKNKFFNPVVVCTVNCNNNSIPVVARVKNATYASFDVKIQNPTGSAVSAETVHYLVVEEGLWITPDFRIIQASRLVPAATNGNGAWGPAPMVNCPINEYILNPVVFGQVMTYNDTDWSVFWSRDIYAATEPPLSGGCYVGYHVGEDTDTSRLSETLGVIVIDGSIISGEINDVSYQLALGADTVQGMGDSPPYTYSLSAFSSTPECAIVTQSAMDDGDGSWSYLYGANPMSATEIHLSVDEDQIGDSERSHQNEQVGFLVFENGTSFDLKLPEYPIANTGDPYGYLLVESKGNVSTNKGTPCGKPTGKDIDVAFIERTSPRIDFDENVKLNVDPPQFIRGGLPELGETVVFTAHVKNAGSVDAGMCDYTWTVDGTVESEGEIEVTGNDYTEIALNGFEWPADPVDIEFDIQLRIVNDDLYLNNNSLTISSHSLLWGLWVHQSVYDYFTCHQRDLGIGSNSFEDWANRLVSYWNMFFGRSIYPAAPNGILDRVHLDRVTIVPDPDIVDDTFIPPEGIRAVGGGYSWGNRCDCLTRNGDRELDYTAANWNVCGGAYNDKSFDYIFGISAFGFNASDYEFKTTNVVSLTPPNGNFYYQYGAIHEPLHGRNMGHPDNWNWAFPFPPLAQNIDDSVTTFKLSGVDNGIADLKNRVGIVTTDESDRQVNYEYYLCDNGEVLYADINSPQYDSGTELTTFSNVTRGALATTATSHNLPTRLVPFVLQLFDSTGVYIQGNDDFIPYPNPTVSLYKMKYAKGLMLGAGHFQFAELNTLVYNYLAFTRSPFFNRNSSSLNIYVQPGDTKKHSAIEEAPDNNIIRVVDSEGEPIENAEVELYRGSMNVYYGKSFKGVVIDDTRDFPIPAATPLTTSSQGEVTISGNPFGKLITPPSRTHLMVVKVIKGSNRGYAIFGALILLKQYFRNLIDETANDGVLLAVMNWDDDPGHSPTTVISFTNGTKSIDLNGEGNLLMNNSTVNQGCAWGVNPDPLVYSCFHDNNTEFIMKIIDSSGEVLCAIDKANVNLHLRALSIETGSHPDAYNGAIRIKDNSGNDMALFDASGSVVLKHTMF